MCASKPNPNASLGFSLVELLVALVFTSILMTGMFKVFQSSISSFATTTETMGIQRNARWALAQLRDDVSMAGYLLPPRVVSELIQDSQEPIQIDTVATIDADTSNSYSPDGTTTITFDNPDELVLVMDVPLGVEGTLSSAANLNDASLSVDIPRGGATLLPGDVAFVQDSSWEMFKIGTPGTSNPFSLPIQGTTLDMFGNDQGGAFSPNVGAVHFAGAPVTFVRPLQVVRYTIKSMNLDPSNDAATVPCLVKQTKNIGGTAWTTTQVLVEGVTRFSTDWSLDGGVTFIRRDTASHPSTWTDIKTATQDMINTLKTKRLLTAQAPPSMSDATNPMWFNYVPLLLRLDVETRTRTPRTEYSANNQTAAYRTRQQTLLVSPRNFALGQPQ